MPGKTFKASVSDNSLFREVCKCDTLKIKSYMWYSQNLHTLIKHLCLVIGHTKIGTCTLYILQKLLLIWYTFIFGSSLSPVLVMEKCALGWHYNTFSQVKLFCQNFRSTKKYINILSEGWWTLQPRRLWAGSPWWRQKPDRGTRRWTPWTWWLPQLN